MSENKKTILLDLDGVLNTYNNNYNPDYIPPMRQGAASFVKKLAKKYNVKLFTTRSKNLASDWLTRNSLNEFIKDVTNEKGPAWLIIDDRCIRFKGKYEELMKEIDNFQVWYDK